jgi:hypothetical protein
MGESTTWRTAGDGDGDGDGDVRCGQDRGCHGRLSEWSVDRVAAASGNREPWALHRHGPLA